MSGQIDGASNGKDKKSGGTGNISVPKAIRVTGRAVTGDGDPISRGEFIAMLARALRLDEKPIGSFDDVRQNHPFYEEIMKVARLGVVRPDAAGRFYPDRAITRAEVAAFVYDCSIALSCPLPAHGADALRSFPDAGEVPAPYLTQTRAVFGERIMIGIGAGKNETVIGIGREATLGQVALVIYRYMLWLDEN
jgi:hypothetical protein